MCLDDFFQIDEEDKLQSCICHKLLRHSALKYDLDDDDPIEHDNVCKWNIVVQLSLKRPNRVNNKSGYMQKRLKVKKSKVVPAKGKKMKKIVGEKSVLRKLRIHPVCIPTGSVPYSYKCCYPGCKSTNKDGNVKFHKVQPEPLVPRTQRYEQIKITT